MPVKSVPKEALAAPPVGALWQVAEFADRRFARIFRTQITVTSRCSGRLRSRTRQRRNGINGRGPCGGDRRTGRMPFMPASRILEGSLREQHPTAHISSGVQPQPPNGARAGYQGRSPISVNLFVTSRKTFAPATYVDVVALRGLSQCYANY